MEKIIVILPPPPFGEEDRKRLINNLKLKFDKSHFYFVTRNIYEDIEYYGNFADSPFWMTPEGKIYNPDLENNNEYAFDIAVIVQNKFAAIAFDEKKIKWLKNKTHYIYDSISSNFFKHQKKIGKIQEKKSKEKNIFNEIARNTQVNPREYIYYPYGFYVRAIDDKDVNDFGFRIPDDYQKLKNRDANHKLICILGGSSAYSVFAKKEESFSYLLEKKLNDNSGQKYSVLNFGMPSYVMLNEIITYTLFIWELKPDVVLSFSGYNDLHHGVISDDYLKDKFNMNYACWLEGWAAKLRGMEYQEPDSWYINRYNSVYPTIKSFGERLQQFRNMVELNNSKFYFALQPYWGSKKSHSIEEKYNFQYVHNKEPNQPLIETLNFLYNRFEYYANEFNIKIDINFHKIFNNYDSKKTFFADICHFNREGEKCIAEKIFGFLKNEEI